MHVCVCVCCIKCVYVYIYMYKYILSTNIFVTNYLVSSDNRVSSVTSEVLDCVYPVVQVMFLK